MRYSKGGANKTGGFVLQLERRSVVGEKRLEIVFVKANTRTTTVVVVFLLLLDRYTVQNMVQLTPRPPHKMWTYCIY